jgi:4-amino-4-deoxy-L-arabinose transferase-like glycosyltransferase
MNKLSEKQQLLLLLIMALIIRLYAAFHTPVIAKDGTIYLQNALLISSGEFSKGLEGYPPVYPTLVAIFYKMMGDSERAGQAVSVIFGTLALFPFYGLSKEIFGKKIASVASIFFVFQPFLVQHAGEIISESTYIFFYLSTLYMGWKALRDEKGVFYFCFGLLAALAYLTRPEGIGLLVGFLIWLPIYLRLARQRFSFRLCGGVLLAIIPFVILVTPYLLHVRETTGEWRLNKKRNMVVDSGLHKAIKKEPPRIDLPSDSQAPIDPEESLSQKAPVGQSRISIELNGLFEFMKGFIKTLILSLIKFTGILHVVLFIFVIVLLIQRKFFSYHFEGELFLFFFAILYFLGMALLYVSGRHLLQVVSLFLPWSAAGLLELAERFGSGVNINIEVRDLRMKVSTSALLIALTIGILLPKTLASHRADKLSLKEAALWIKSQKVSSPAILSTDSRVAYYAEGRHIQLAHEGETFTIGQGHKPDFVVIEKDEIPEISPDTLLSLKPMTLKEVFHIEREDGSSAVTIYTLVAI